MYQEIIQALQSDYISLFELAWFNNPVSLTYALRQMGFTNKVHPDQEEVTAIVKRLANRKDFTDMKSILAHFTFDPNTKNFTTDASLWSEMGVHPGDFNTLANKLLI